MNSVSTLETRETASLDRDQIDKLLGNVDPMNAEDMVCRAIEDLAVRLGECDAMWRSQDHLALRKRARSIAAISGQIGMSTLRRAAHNVTECVDAGDPVALSATVARMIRVGERSLMAVWDLDDLSY